MGLSPSGDRRAGLDERSKAVSEALRTVARGMIAAVERGEMSRRAAARRYQISESVATLGKISLFILDWDVVLIEGAMLETWLPQVFARLEELAQLCRARRGSIGAFIEDKNSGTILLQQALRRQMPAHPINSKLTAMGKHERAISVSGYVHRELVKYADRAFEKTVIYKRHSRNHLLDQVESFRVGDRDGDREDDLLDTFCYGVALALGNSEGF